MPKQQRKLPPGQGKLCTIPVSWGLFEYEHPKSLGKADEETEGGGGHKPFAISYEITASLCTRVFSLVQAPTRIATRHDRDTAHYIIALISIRSTIARMFRLYIHPSVVALIPRIHVACSLVIRIRKWL